jgi:hypothetical protein
MKVNNHGGGIVSFDNAIELNRNFFNSYIKWLREAEEETFTYLEEDGKKYAINKTGFKFEINDIPEAPERFVDLLGKSSGREASEEVVNFIKQCEDALYECLVEYCALYPEAATTIWWRGSAHIAGYNKGRWIGPHCDDQIQFEFDGLPKNEYPIHNTISCALYFNDCVDSEEDLNGDNFVGGHIKFKYAGVDFSPKAGSAVLYPSSYMGTHEVTPVTSGERYVYLEFFAYGIPKNSPGTDLKYMPNLIKDSLEKKNKNGN